MLLREFLDAAPANMLETMRQQLMDYLTPLMAHEVAFVTINDIANTLHNLRTGLEVDRALIMELIDPDQMPIVKRIEGDKVYLDTVEAAQSDSSEEEQAKAEEKVKGIAVKQAKKEIKNG